MTLIRPELTTSHHLDRWVRDFFRSDFPFRGFWDLDVDGAGLGRNAYLAADLHEDANAFHVMMELPGVSKKAIHVELENSVLRVSGKHTDASGDSDHAYEFSRSLSVPDGINPEGIHAVMQDGVLQITMPKAEERKPRAIEIK